MSEFIGRANNCILSNSKINIFRNCNIGYLTPGDMPQYIAH